MAYSVQEFISYRPNIIIFLLQRFLSVMFTGTLIVYSETINIIPVSNLLSQTDTTRFYLTRIGFPFRVSSRYNRVFSDYGNKLRFEGIIWRDMEHLSVKRLAGIIVSNQGMTYSQKL